MTAVNSIKQNDAFSNDITSLMETFKQMINFCIKTGLQENVSIIKKFLSLHYKDMSQFDMQSKNKIKAINPSRRWKQVS